MQKNAEDLFQLYYTLLHNFIFGYFNSFIGISKERTEHIKI